MLGELFASKIQDRHTMSKNSPATRTSLQNIMLLRLEKEFGFDVSGAADLSGHQLDAWIEQAGDDLFLELVVDPEEREQLQAAPSPKKPGRPPLPADKRRTARLSMRTFPAVAEHAALVGNAAVEAAIMRIKPKP